MENKILVAVDGSKKGFETVSILGGFLREQSRVGIVLFHCVHQLAAREEDLCTNMYESCKLSLADQEKVGHEILNEAVKRLQAAGFPGERVEARLKTDSLDPALDIIAEAEQGNYETIAVGRRGRGNLETLLLGSVSGKVAHYAPKHTVWVVDTPVFENNKVLIAMEGAPDSLELVRYAADVLGPIPRLEYTFLHLMPSVPPTFWDDGHILSPDEEKDPRSRLEQWRTEWTTNVREFMSRGRLQLVEKGVPEDNIRTLILPTRQGVARDLLQAMEEDRFKLVFMGKKSLHERKPFLMGSHSNKILQAAKGIILCLVDF